MGEFKEKLQRLGKSMLLPVAAMPLSGLIMRLAADDMLNIPVFGAAGNAVFGNLDILFAIGVAIGFAKAKDKSVAALTGFLAIMTLKAGLKVMNPELSMGIFGGIISGCIAAWTYNRFKNQKLPLMFSYFAGEKFPLTMVMIFQTISVIIFGVIWPFIQAGIDSFARLLVNMGAFGVGLFAFLNRLLIPFGLHHVLNTYIYFDLGSYTTASGEVVKGEITRFISGDPTAGSFLSGFFVVMMFGVPAICLAIYKAAFKERRQEVKGVMMGGAAVSFVANITEPIEFNFMFVSPVLYVIHAVYAGIAAMVCYMFDIRIGFTFGACIVDYIINFRIANNPLMILPIGVVFFILYYFTFYYFIKAKNVAVIGRETESNFGEEIEEIEKDLNLKSKNYAYMAKKLLDAFGGIANIEEAFSCTTRLRIQVKDPSVVNEQRIKQLGVSGIIKPTDTNYQVVIGLEVSYVMGELNKLLDL